MRGVVSLGEGEVSSFGTIVVDPPWEYRSTGIVTASRRAATRPEAAAQYETLSLSELLALDVGALAAADAHLYLWTTNPLLRQAFDLVDAWGFEYRTTITWLKQGTLGMGFYFRGETEHVLFATRGRCPIPADRRARNWFVAPRRGHSVKPDCFLDMVERVSPGPYAELFARRARFGWEYPVGDQALAGVRV